MLIYFGLIIGIIGVEIILKEWVKERENDFSENYETKKQKGKFFGLRIKKMENDGAAGGILSGQQSFLKKFTGILLGISALWLFINSRKQKISVTGLGLAMFLGGGIGNLADRIKKGSVTDYLQFTTFPIKFIRKLIFNLSDFFIIIGGIFILFGENFKIKK